MGWNGANDSQTRSTTSIGPCAELERSGRAPSERLPVMSRRSAWRSSTRVGLLLLLAACKTADVPPVTEAPQEYAQSHDELRLLYESDAYEKEIREQGLVLDHPDLAAYVDGVGARLVPQPLPERLEFRFYVLREPTINAFAMAQGAIFLHQGLLVRLENEAQLAHVLAHEITHTIERHQLEFKINLENRTVAAKVSQLVLVPPAWAFGAGFVADTLIGLTWAASVTGYGRDLEEHADLVALERIAAAGYRIDEAPELFDRLQEVEDPGALESFFYASHPGNAARAAYTRQVIESGWVQSQPDAVVHREVYQSAIEGLITENVRLRLRAKHYQYAAREAQWGLEKRPDDAGLHYELGEAHRLTAADPEGAAREDAARRRELPDRALIDKFEAQAPDERSRAEAAYRRALELDPNFPLPHRGLGLVAHQRGDAEAARRELETYLSLAEEPWDRRYIESILGEISDD